MRKSQTSQILLLSSLIIGAVLMLIACVHEPIGGVSAIDPTSGGGSGGSGTGVTGSTLIECSSDTAYFNRDIYPLLTSNCAMAGCHGNGSREDGVDLSTYTTIIQTGEVRPGNSSRSDMYKVLLETGDDRMPPSPRTALTTEQIALVKLWIDQGALENSCESCDTTAFTFSASIAPLIKNQCEGCHSGSAPSGGISLNNHAEIKAIVANNLLVNVVERNPGVSAMPPGNQAMAACEISQLKSWIAAGALND